LEAERFSCAKKKKKKKKEERKEEKWKENDIVKMKFFISCFLK